MFKIAKTDERREERYCRLKYVRDENGTLKVKEEEVMERCTVSVVFFFFAKQDK